MYDRELTETSFLLLDGLLWSWFRRGLLRSRSMLHRLGLFCRLRLLCRSGRFRRRRGCSFLSLLLPFRRLFRFGGSRDWRFGFGLFSTLHRRGWWWRRRRWFEWV